MSFHRRGDLDAARRLYLAHLEQHPDDAGALCLLGALEGQGGDHTAAEETYRRAVQADPNHGPAYAGLGTSFLLQDRPADAVEVLANAVELAPDQPEPRLQYTAALQRCGRLLEARQALTDFVARWPDHLESRHNLGLLMLQTDSPDMAATHFRFVLDREPTRFATWMGLARALFSANDAGGAEAALSTARDLAPGDPAPTVLLGMVLQEQGRFQEARTALEAALGIAPRHAPAIIGIAELDLATGDAASGLERIAELSGDETRLPGARSVTIRLLAAAGRREEAVALLDGWLEEGDVPPRTRAGLMIQKGQLLDDLGRFDAAWDAWSQARRQAPPRIPAGHFSHAVDRLVHAFGDTFFHAGQQKPQAGDHLPLLIVGAPRSGKSVLEQVLACHPAVRGAGELRVLGRLSNEIARRYGSAVRPYPDCIGALGEEDVADLRATYFEALGRCAGDARWVTDTQPTNFLHVGLAARLVPGLRVIFCRRDPVDIAWACLSRQFADPGLDFVATPAGVGVYLNGMMRLMRHWATAIPLEILEVRYEDLVQSTRATLERVTDYLDLDWDESLMAYAEPGRADLACAPALAGPLNAGEIGRGRPYRQRLGIGDQEAAADDHG